MMSPIDDIIQTAEAERALLWREVVALTPEQASFRPDQGTWSIGMILEHLLIGEERLVARFAAARQGKQLDDPLPPPVELRFRQEDYPDVGKTGKRTAPPNAVPQGTMGLAEVLFRLHESRRRLLDEAMRCRDLDLSSFRYTHRLLGSMDLWQWIGMQGKHEMRHLRQIKAIKQHPAYPPG
jgi:hypothetical protein